MKNCKSYVVNLPLFKIGDDLGGELEHNKNDSSKAFLAMSERYEFCSNLYKKLANICKEHPEVKIENADTHMITIIGPKDILGELVKSGDIDEWSAIS